MLFIVQKLITQPLCLTSPLHGKAVPKEVIKEHWGLFLSLIHINQNLALLDLKSKSKYHRDFKSRLAEFILLFILLT